MVSSFAWAVFTVIFFVTGGAPRFLLRLFQTSCPSLMSTKTTQFAFVILILITLITCPALPASIVVILLWGFHPSTVGLPGQDVFRTWSWPPSWPTWLHSYLTSVLPSHTCASSTEERTANCHCWYSMQKIKHVLPISPFGQRCKFSHPKARTQNNYYSQGKMGSRWELRHLAGLPGGGGGGLSSSVIL